jgi:hypothetical protein
LRTRQWTARFRKFQGISWPDEELLAFKTTSIVLLGVR